MSDSIELDFAVEPPFEGADDPLVMFVIAKNFIPDSTDDELYEMTRGNWVIGANSRAAARFALGIAGGIVRSAFQIGSWDDSSGRYAPETAKGLKNRSYFTGRRTPETDTWIGSSVRHLAPPKGAANPVRLFLDGVPAPVRPHRVNYAQQIADEPLAQIMFGNSELFHSNMLAWIFNAFPKESDQLFQTFVQRSAGSGGRWVDREKDNLDLAFHWPDADPLVVENKVFSVPTPEQLDRYAKKVSKWSPAPGKLLLLSPARPHFIKDGHHTRYSDFLGNPLIWEHLSFQTLAESLEAAFDGKEPSYEVETVLRYAVVLHALGGLIESTRIWDGTEPAFVSTGDVDQYLTKQMIANLSKARAERVAEHVNAQLVRIGKPTTAYSLFSRATPGVSNFLQVQRDGYTFEAGWQYQGGQFRLALIIPHLVGKGSDGKELRAAFARNYPEYFSFDHLDRILDSSRVNLSENKQGKIVGAFNHFDPDFIYRYKKLPHLSVEQLTEAAMAHVQYLSRLSE